MKVDWHDLLLRALKTFFQAFLSALTVDGLFDVTSGNELKHFALTTGLSALAAAISAAWNLIAAALTGGKPDQGVPA